MKKSIAALFATAFLLANVQTAEAQVEFLGSIRIPGTTTDLSGLTGELEGGVPVNQLGGFSAIEYSGEDNVYYVLPDRGAGDGAVSYPCRVHKVALNVDAQSGNLEFEQIGTILLKNKKGESLIGSEARMLEWDGQGRCPSYDPEGIRLTADGHMLITDEYGPFADLFDSKGSLVRELVMPERISLGTRRKPQFSSGTFTNRGMEGVSLIPGSDRFLAVMQGPLIQDGRIEANKCLGIKTRWILGELSSNRTREIVYSLTDESTGISEVLAVDSSRYLVLERDSNVGAAALIKKIYLADLTGVTDVSNIESLITPDSSRFKEVQKKEFIDLLTPEYGLNGETVSGKPEGLAWGPRLPDGRRLLIVCYDNDFVPTTDSIIAAFAIDSLD
ncbi:MAG: esterase-like activity of phytase family protein [Pirellula sp.]|nr:esterase-like activity of phytase family protein [Pirellula sp.]